VLRSALLSGGRCSVGLVHVLASVLQFSLSECESNLLESRDTLSSCLAERSLHEVYRGEAQNVTSKG
jgi:hypothetical protein